MSYWGDLNTCKYPEGSLGRREWDKHRGLVGPKAELGAAPIGSIPQEESRKKDYYGNADARALIVDGLVGTSELPWRFEGNRLVIGSKTVAKSVQGAWRPCDEVCEQQMKRRKKSIPEGR